MVESIGLLLFGNIRYSMKETNLLRPQLELT